MSSKLPDAKAITRRLRGDSIFESVTVLASTGSTNADLADGARSGRLAGAALVAMEQTAGRGRLDRQWVSLPGASVALSVLLKPTPEFSQWGWLSILAGMAVSSALRQIADDPSIVTLKWPNDVLLRGKKVCGILSERIERPEGAMAVVGMGINLTLTESQLPVPTATSLVIEGMNPDAELIVSLVLRQFEDYYRTWETRGSLREEYEARCASVGAQLSITVDAGHRCEGIGRGVDEFGRLQVATTEGLQTFAVGDVVHARLGS